MKKWSLVAVLLASTVLVGCTGDGAGVAATTWPNPPTPERPSTPTPSPSSAASASSPSRTSGSSVGPTSDPAATITPPSVQEAPFGTSSADTTTAAPQTSGPWPPTFTGEQVTWAQEALTAWQEFDAATRAAYSEPSEQAIERIRLHAVDPVATDEWEVVTGMIQNGVRQSGFVSYELRTASVAQIDRAELDFCADMSQVVAHYADGTEIPVELDHARSVVSAVMVRDAEGQIPWAVAEVHYPEIAC